MIYESQLPIPRTTLTELVNVYKQAEEDIKKAYELLDGAEKSLNTAMMTEGPTVDLSSPYSSQGFRSGPDYQKPEDTVGMVSRQMWKVLIERMELRSLMSIKKASELDKQLQTGEGLPAITEQNILAMMEGTLGQVQGFMKEAINEVFEFLRPHRSAWNNYKTNSDFEIGPKVILSYCVTGGYGNNVGKFQVNYNYEKNLTALDNVFSLLDGKGAVKTYYGPLTDAIKASPDGRGETAYFEFKCFQNGNLHLKFRRLDLVAKLNVEAGGNRLKKDTE